jgi:hypothetical protein
LKFGIWTALMLVRLTVYPTRLSSKRPEVGSDTLSPMTISAPVQGSVLVLWIQSGEEHLDLYGNAKRQIRAALPSPMPMALTSEHDLGQ